MTAALSAANTKRGRLQRTCLEMLQARRHQPDGLPTSTRFIFYELVQMGVIKKKREAGETGCRSDQDVCEAIFVLRRVGEIPWDWIVDETRSIEDWRYSDSVADYVKDMVEEARIDVWDGAAPPMVLRNLAFEYLVPVAATNGQVGGFLRNVTPALSPGQRVLYLSDWDLQGAQIEANTRTVLQQPVGGDLAWERLAITEEQVRANDLPVISKPDRRYKPVRYQAAVETEALGQSVIVNIVRGRLNALPEPLARVCEREQAQRAKVRTALARFARSAP